MINTMRADGQPIATKVAQTGRLLPHWRDGLLIRRRLKSNRLADYQSAAQQTASRRYDTDL
jgi:hypothetical protein